MYVPLGYQFCPYHYDLSIRVWNCSDSMIFYVFHHFIIVKNKILKVDDVMI